MPSEAIDKVIKRIENYKLTIGGIYSDLKPFKQRVEFKEADDAFLALSRLKESVDELEMLTHKAVEQEETPKGDKFNDLYDDEEVIGDDEIVGNTDDGSDNENELDVNQQQALQNIGNQLEQLADRIHDDMMEIEQEMQQ